MSKIMGSTPIWTSKFVFEADSYPVVTYFFLFAWEHGKAINARKAFWEKRGKNNFLPFFP